MGEKCFSKLNGYTVKDAHARATKVNIEKNTVYIDTVLSEFGAAVDVSGTLQNLVDSYDTVILPKGNTYYIGASVHIKKPCNIICDGVIKVAPGVKAFIVGSMENNVTRNSFKIYKAYSDGMDSESVLFSLQNAQYNLFDIPYAEDMGKVVEFYPIGHSIGENIFYPHLWHGCNIAFHMMGSDTWSNSVWAEGSQLMGGFISGCRYGVKIEENIKYSGMYVTTAIDNMEVPGSYDWYNGGTESPTYAIANLLLFRFIRLANCKFANLDSYWDANLRLKITGEFEANGPLIQKNANGQFVSLAGQTEIYNPDVVLLDMKNDAAKDYDVRLSVSNGEMGCSTKEIGMAFTVKKDGFQPARSGANVAISAGATEITINHSQAMLDDKYIVIVTPSWNTRCYIVVKNTNGFVIKFDTAPTENETIDWCIFKCN